MHLLTKSRHIGFMSLLLFKYNICLNSMGTVNDSKNTVSRFSDIFIFQGIGHSAYKQNVCKI